jgi:hypothetical protein
LWAKDAIHMRGLNKVAGLIGKTKVSKWLIASAAAVTLAAPVVTQAAPGPWHGGDDDHGRYDDHRNNDHDQDRGRFGVNIRVGEPRPRYITREVQVWVPAVYRTECEKVWVPDVFEDREVHFVGGKGRLRTRIDHVLVAPGHYENRDRQALVTPGHYETRCEQVKVSDGDAGFRIRS